VDKPDLGIDYQMFIRTTAIDKLKEMTARKRVVQGGTSAGKTFGILPILINTALNKPNREISIVSESVPHLRRGVIKDFLKIMMWTNRYTDSQFNKTLLTYNFKNGSFIEFFSVDQPDKLRGARREILYVNEANNIDFESYYQLAIRTSDTIWLDYNPTSDFWVHQEVLTEPDSEKIILTYKDNEALPDTIKNEIELNKEKAKTSNYWANWWQVYGLGETGSLQGVVFDNYSLIDNLPEEVKLLGYGADWGFTNDPTTVIGIYKWNGQYIFHEIIYQKGLVNSEIANLLKVNGVDRSHWIYADSAEPKTISDISSYGFKIRGADKGKDSIIFGIALMQDSKFLVTKQSTNLIKELRNYTWDTDKDGKQVNKPIDAFNHCIDAIRYFVSMQNKNSGKYNLG
jgi:phage terminase large subunit